MGQAVLIAGVFPESIAEELGLEPGDCILSINGQTMEDLIDYRFLIADEELELRVIKGNGEEWVLEIEKDYDQELGLVFEESTFDGIKRCQNRCVFCFVDQMPSGMRDTLYVKDDDYRMSFLHGNFVTLTNLKEEDLERIIRLRLSPLYISVHTTNPQLRRKMLNNQKAGGILDQLKKLAGAGIQFHAQIVLCPEINDGRELDKTVADLLNLYPSVLSVAIVPVGLTEYRQNLFPLREFTSPEAMELVRKTAEVQRTNRDLGRPSLVFLADEFYLLAGEPFPPAEAYDDFPQLENGVGLARLFIDDLEEALADFPGALPEPRRITLISGLSGGKVLSPLLDRLAQTINLNLRLQVVENGFFGGRVTATGLLTGLDLIRALEGQDLGDVLIIPGVMLRSGEQALLDDTTVEEISDRLRVPVEIAGDAWELVDLIKGF